VRAYMYVFNLEEDGLLY